MAKWLGEAWSEYTTGVGPQRIADTFKRVGLMNAFDGSENNLVKVQGVENYSFEGDSESEGDSDEGSGEGSDEESYEESDEESDESNESKSDGDYMSDIETD